MIYIKPMGKLTCPVRILSRFLNRRGISLGWLFQAENGGQLSTGTISLIVKHVAAEAGLWKLFITFAAHWSHGGDGGRNN